MSFITKEERDALWEKLRKRNAREHAVDHTPAPWEWEVVEREGKKVLLCPWHQELPARGAELFFWEQLEHIRKHLIEGGTEYSLGNEFLVGHPAPDRGVEDIKNFCMWVLKDAHDRALEKENERLEKVEDVRQSVGYYEEG